MPRLPEIDQELYAKNTTEQYAALGHFVVSFELMVSAVRNSCIDLLTKDTVHYGFVSIPFHHGVFTAKPLFDVWRAIVALLVGIGMRRMSIAALGADAPPMLIDPITEKEKIFNAAQTEIFAGVLVVLNKEFNTLSNNRNNLLHATWYVGFPTDDDPNSSGFFVTKLTTSAEGLSPIDLPKQADELRDLSHRCDVVRDWIGYVDGCLTSIYSIEETFERADKGWKLKTGRRTTLQ